MTTDDVLNGAIDLDSYPHRYLALVPVSTLRSPMGRLLEAVELLEDRSWELVNILAKENFYAVLRRA
ncbi:hypothetical protein GCM10010170_032010 [Dactylosporangium salmoneum]|uniref:Uncharacterized protein n=1 Tax=Dactylosporangium salmoneum TaxID=53361 RepID=A0ABN3G780_9ACTN